MAEVSPTASTERTDESAGGFGSLGSILFLLILAWTALLAVRPLNDNSFLTHLATGRLILEDGSVPSADPYTYTAGGEPWTVQSWLASVGYAAAESLGGAVGLRLFIAAIFGCAAVLLWKLSAPARSLVPRLLIMAVAMTVASSVWSERPYMTGFIGLALVWLALDGRVPNWTLIPYMWLWVNSHGSYPLAVALCIAVIAGRAADERRLAVNDLRHELHVLAAVLGGAALGVLSPLGFRALTFPVQAVTRSERFGLIAEWQAPEFTSIFERAFLLLALLAVAGVISRQRWRDALPLLLFLAAGLVARRNMVMALPVLVAVASGAVPPFGTLRSSSRPKGGQLLAVPLGALVVVIIAAGIQGPHLALGDYPIRALAHVQDVAGAQRIVSQDYTGNLLEALDGPSGSVFVDDRADMFPPAVFDDYVTLNRASRGWFQVLDRYETAIVVWDSTHPLATVLAASPDWQITYSDAGWIVALRRDGTAQVKRAP